MDKQPYRIHFRQGDFELEVEGDRAFVESYVAAFVAGAPAEAKRPEPGRKPGRKKAAAKRRGRKAAAPPAPSVDAGALRAYMKGKRPKSVKERYLVYLGFLKSKGTHAASDALVKACFVAEGRPIPTSGRQNFSFLKNEGLVRPGPKRGLWALSEEGLARLEKPAPKAKRGRKVARKPKRSAVPAVAKAKAKPVKRAKAKAAGKRAKPVKAAEPTRAKAAKPGPSKAKRLGKRKAAKPSKPKILRVKAEPEEHDREVVPPDAMPD